MLASSGAADASPSNRRRYSPTIRADRSLWLSVNGTFVGALPDDSAPSVPATAEAGEKGAAPPLPPGVDDEPSPGAPPVSPPPEPAPGGEEGSSAEHGVVRGWVAAALRAASVALDSITASAPALCFK